MQTKTYGELDSPFGYISLYSSCGNTSATSIHPSKQLVGKFDGKGRTPVTYKIQKRNTLKIELMSTVF